MKNFIKAMILFPTIISLNILLLSQNSFAEETSLTLETAMNMAENYCFKARIAAKIEEINQGKVDEKHRGMLPSIGLSGQYLNYSSSVNKAVGTSAGSQLGIPKATVYTAALTLTQPLVGLFPLYLALQQASAQTEAALYNKEQSKTEARFLGANSFINAVKAIQLLNVANSSVQVAQTQLRDGQAQFNAGKLTNADILKFKLNLENAKTTLIEAQTTAKITLVTLAETIGLKDTKSISLPKNYSSIWSNKKIQFQNLSNYVNKALSKRNDLKAAKSSTQVAKFGKYSSYLPTVNFVSNYSRNFEAEDVNITAIPGYSSSVNYSKSDIQDQLYYGIQFSWNLLDWGIRQAQISEAVANESASNIEENQVESQIKIDVTNNYLQLQDSYQNLDSAKVSVEYAKDVFLQMEAQFINGQATTTEVLSAANDQTSALAKLATAVGDLDLAWLSLQKSTGNTLSTLINN